MYVNYMYKYICVSSFTDPQHWLEYFPPVAKADLQALGVRVS